MGLKLSLSYGRQRPVREGWVYLINEADMFPVLKCEVVAIFQQGQNIGPREAVLCKVLVLHSGVSFLNL